MLNFNFVQYKLRDFYPRFGKHTLLYSITSITNGCEYAGQHLVHTAG